MRGYALIAGAVGALALVGYIWVLKTKNTALSKENEVLQAQVDGHSARSTNILEDKASDAEIDADALSDAALDLRGAEWMLEEPTRDPDH